MVLFAYFGEDSMLICLVDIYTKLTLAQVSCKIKGQFYKIPDYKNS